MTATIEEAVKQDIDTYITKLKDMAFQLGYETAHNDFLEIRKSLEDSAYNRGYEAAKEEFNIPSVPIDFIKKKIDECEKHIQAKEDIVEGSVLFGEKMLVVGMEIILELWEKECEQAFS